MAGDGKAVLRAEIGHRLSRIELDVALAVGRETVGLVGPSGAGKSSLLRAVAGLLFADRGRVTLGDAVLFDAGRGIDVPPERRRIGLVFQDGALFPHLSVAENVRFGMRRRGPRELASVLEAFGLAPMARERVGRLSGGERRRVALARALASDPRALLLDEPLSSLDAVTKASAGAELARHLREAGLPAVLVSHDFADVLGLADRVAVMEAGRLVQTGTAAELLAAPESAFVAALTGVNYFHGVATRRDGLTEIRAGEAFLLSTETAAGPVAAVVSPWDVALSIEPPEGSALNSLAGPVVRLTTIGNRVRVAVGSRPPVVAEVTEESTHRLGLAPGVPVVATWKATGTRLVPTGG